MKTLVHLSDLHFGRTDPSVVPAVLATVDSLAPDLVVVSGDLTQRARVREYRAARAFLDRLPQPLIVVPGNHDIALFDPLRRFLWPLVRWKRFISTDLAPHYEDDEVVILGLNTARSFTWKDGRISKEQRQLLEERLGDPQDERFKVVVTHHPFLPPPHRPDAALVGGAEETLHILRAGDVDMILSGHYHHSQAAGTHLLYRRVDHSV